MTDRISFGNRLKAALSDARRVVVYLARFACRLLTENNPMSPNPNAVAEIQGFFRAFEWVNSKTNHGYTFDISTRPKTADINRDVANHFSTYENAETHVAKVADWRETVFDAMVRWLLAYLKDHYRSGRLEDKSKTFSLSSRSFYKDMIDPLIEQIHSISPVRTGYTVHVETVGFYACSYTDIVLDARDCLIFLHFDVCD